MCICVYISIVTYVHMVNDGVEYWCCLYWWWPMPMIFHGHGPPVSAEVPLLLYCLYDGILGNPKLGWARRVTVTSFLKSPSVCITCKSLQMYCIYYIILHMANIQLWTHQHIQHDFRSPTHPTFLPDHWDIISDHISTLNHSYPMTTLRYDIWPRPLGEHAWFSVPIIGELMYSIGAVDGTRRNCDPALALLRLFLYGDYDTVYIHFTYFDIIIYVYIL